MRLARFSVFAIVSALMMPLSAHAGVDWTTCGACGTIDSGSAGIYAYSNHGLSYNGSQSLASLEARYDVVDVDGSNSPGWTTLEIGYQGGNLSGVTIEAILKSVDPSTQNEVQICSVFSDSTHSTRTCTFSGLDFSKYVYYVIVVINRGSGQEYPELDTLRIY